MNKIIVEFSDMPDWVKEQSAFNIGKNKRPTCYINPLESNVAKVGATWHDAARQTIVAYRDGKTVAIRGGYYDSILNFTAEEMVGHQGADFTLNQPEDAIAVFVIYYKLDTIDLYIRRDSSYMKILSGLSDGVELTPVQANILKHLAGLNSMGRKRERQDYYIPDLLITTVARELEEMGLVKINKAGAITVTVAGRREYHQLGRQPWTWWDWRDQHYYARNNGRVVSRYRDFAGDIIAEYRERMIAERSRS